MNFYCLNNSLHYYDFYCTECRNDRRKGHYEVKNIDETNSCKFFKTELEKDIINLAIEWIFNCN